MDIKRVRLISNSENETKEIGNKLAKLINKGDWIALTGGLGSGKTRLIKGIASAYNIPDIEVRSPSYEVVEEYKGNDITIYHVDFYRFIDDEATALDTLYYLQDKEDGIILIEWADVVLDYLPETLLSIQIRYTKENENNRELIFSYFSEKWNEINRILENENIRN